MGLLAALSLITLTVANLLPPPAFAGARDAALKASFGRAALVRGQYQDADRVLTEALQSEALQTATRVFALSNRGLARWRLHDLPAAVSDFNAALRLAPEEPTLYNNRGNVLLELHLHQEAAKDFAQAIALAPAYGAAHHNRGNALFLLGKYAEAMGYYTKAVTLLPQNAAPFNGRGKTQAALSRPAGAIRDFSRAIALNARYGEAYANRAEAMAVLRRYKDAVDDYTSAIESGAKTARVYLGRAAVYRHLKKPGLALEDVAEARRLEPSSVETVAEASEDDSASPDQVKTVSAPAPDADRLCEDGHTAQRRHHGLAQIADASNAGLKTAMLIQARSEVSVPVDPAGSIAVKKRLASPCDPRDTRDPSSLDETADGEDAAEQFMGPEIEDWSVEATPDGYVARHVQHDAIRLTLEMYGSGEPKLLHWQRLKGSLRGVGLLHYYAGASPKGDPLEYVALINVYSGKLIAIEPCRWGEQQATWTWSDIAVVVVDPQGVPSEVKVRDRPVYVPPARTRTAKAKRVKRGLPWTAERKRTRFNRNVFGGGYGYGRRFDPYSRGSWRYR